MTSKYKAAAAIFLALIILGFSGLYFYLKKKGESAAFQAAEYLSKRTKRKTEIGSASYSVIDGLILENVTIKEKDGKTDFFKFKRAEIKLNEKELIKGNLLFEKADFYEGKLRLKQENVGWNFNDLLELLPPSKKPLHLIWNAKALSFKSFEFYFSLQNSLKEISLSKSEFSIKHRSSLGGDFSISLQGLFAGLWKEKLFSFKITSQAELVFDYAKAKSAKVNLEIENIAYDQISGEKAEFSGEFFSLNKEKNKNFFFNLSLKNLFIPQRDKFCENLFFYIAKIEKALGKNISTQKEFLIKDLSLSAKTKDGAAQFNLEAESNILSLSFNSVSSLALKKDELKAKLKAGDLKLEIEGKSDFSKVYLKKDLSETSSEAIKGLFLDFENKFLLEKLL